MQSADRPSCPQVLCVVLDTSIKLKPFTEAMVRSKVIGANGQTGWHTVGPVKQIGESESVGEPERAFWGSPRETVGHVYQEFV